MNLDLHGHFWLPAHEAERVRGRLTWNAASGGELTLEGFLWHDGSPSKSADLLCGRGLDGTPLALVRSFLRRFQSSAPLTQHWRVNGAFLGTFDAEPSTHVLATEVDGLGAFTRTSGLAVQGSNGARDPVHITWSPADPPLSLPAGEGRLKIVDERQLDLDQDRFAVGHVQHLRLTMPQADGWSQVAGRLGIAAGLLELLADRPMAVRRQWRPSEEEQGCIDHFFRPVVGSAPDDPDKVWLTLAHVEGRLGDALRRWTELADAQRHLVSLIIEEVRLRRATNSVDRILRLTRILELLHRHRHPGATPEDDDEADKVNTALGAVPEELQGWLGDRLGVTIIRLRQRIRETLAELNGGLDAVVVEVDLFARTATKTRNWHTHYGDPKGVATGEYAAYLAVRLWLVVRAAILLELGWPPSEAVELVHCDPNAAWSALKPIIAS